MKGILAIETATDACSVALWRDGEVVECHEVIPRQHSQRLFSMLRQLIADGDCGAAGVEAIAYGCGPGSFTGLRVVASAVQGLCFTMGVAAIPVSTLACQVQTAIREGLASEGELVASLIDARINEVYAAVYRVVDGLPLEVFPATACAPGDFSPAIDGGEPLLAIGSGVTLQDQFPEAVQNCVARSDANVLPHARDLVPLAIAAAQQGVAQKPTEVQPVYLRDKINWKKISEQGKRN